MLDLIENLRTINLGSGHLSSTCANYLNGHAIHDVPQDVNNVKIIFLVESPHKKERCHKYPLAGSGGSHVTSTLIFDHNLHNLQAELTDEDRNTPIGKLVYENRIPWLSIMNVSLFPLQKKSYDNAENQSRKIRILWCALEEIKRKLQISGRENPDLCPTSREVYEVIINDLAHRIKRVTRQCQPKFIPFGNIARRSLDRAKEVRPCLQELPVSGVRVRHPSAWYRFPYENRCLDLTCVAFDIRTYLVNTFLPES